MICNQPVYLLSQCKQSNGEGLWFVPWGVHIVLPKDNNEKLERSKAQALLYGPLNDKISHEIGWFEKEMAADSLTYQMLTIFEYERQ